MSSLVLFSYKQPVEGSKFRWGVLESRLDTFKSPLSLNTLWGSYRSTDRSFQRTRNTNKEPLERSTIRGYYRWDDPAFERSRDLDTVLTKDGVKCFYRERQKWGVKIPFVGSLVKPFLAK